MEKAKARRWALAAIEKEKAAIEFYLVAAGMATQHKARVMFQQLACDEVEHLVDLFKRFHQLRPKRGTILPLRFRWARKAVQEAKEYVSEGLSDRRALEIALEREKRSIEWFNKAIGETKDQDLKELLLELAGDEERHFSMLHAEYKYLFGTALG